MEHFVIKNKLFCLVFTLLNLSAFSTFAQPNITNFTPEKGEIGLSITINGSNFNTLSSKNVVFFGAAKAEIISATSTKLIVRVPVGATFSKITVLDLETKLIKASENYFVPTFTPNTNKISTSEFGNAFSLASPDPYDFNIADLDGDGKNDVVVANIGSSSISVFRNISRVDTIDFAPKSDYTTGSFPTSVAIDDLNGDGKLDMVVTNTVSGSISIFKNTSTSGNISFSTKLDIISGADTRKATIKDIDLDGNLDIVTVNYNSNTLSIFRNLSTLGNITFDTKVDLVTLSNPRWVGITDIDGDGKLDLTVVSQGVSKVSIYQNTSTPGNISFSPKIDLTGTYSSFGVWFGDIDNDGKSELILSDESNGVVTILRNTSTIGNILFSTKIDFTVGATPQGLSLSDIDGDGKIDILVPNLLSGTVSILKNSSSVGAISFLGKLDLTTNVNGARFTQMSDIDGDGIVDLLFSNQNSKSISIYKNTPKFPPNTPNTLLADSGPRRVKLTWVSSTSSGVNNYNVYRSTDNITYSNIGSTISLSYIDSTLTPFVNYYFKITAFDSLDIGYDNYGLESSFSNIVSGTSNRISYVDSASGNNTTGYGNSLHSYKTIQKAIDFSSIGDTIYVKAGTYTENLIINKKIVIISIDGSAKTFIKPLLPNSQIVNFTSGASDSKLSGFKLLNGGNVRGSAIDCNFSNPIIENCIITNSAGEAPIRFYYSAAIITNCLIYKNTANNVFFYDPNDYVPTITHSTIAYNVGIGTGSSNSINIPIFTNSIIYGNTGGSYSGNINILNSIVQGGYPGNSTNIDANPKFVDSLNNNFHLSDYSPAIGIGKKAITETKDFELNNRIIPTGSFPDAGAYENIYDHPAPYIDTDSSRNGYVLLKMTQTPAGTVNKINIYKGLTTSPTTKYKDTTLVSKYADSLNSVFNKIIYYRLTSVGASNLESGYSNEVRTISFTPPSLNFPTDLSVKADTNINFQWEKIDNATKYKIQYSTDSNFVTNVVELSKTDTSHLKTSLVDNTSYFWRLQTLDTVHYSMWSNLKRFQTFVRKPVLASIISTNKSITLSWTVNSIRNIKSFKIYKGTATSPITKVDSISSSNLSYTDTIENGNIFYYRVTAINTDNIESDYSNEMYANSFGITVLTSPVNNNTKESLTPSFKWDAINLATLNNIQISTDSLFINTPVIDTITSLKSFTYNKGLTDNSTYYWRVRVGDSKGYGNWTARNTFQTLVLSPKLLSIQTGNKVDTLKWSVTNSNNLKYFKIYSDTINNPTKLKDSISGALSTYIDKTNLQLNIKYYYRIIAGNQQNIESDYSNILAATPINTLPKAIKLSNKTVQNSGEYNFVKLSYSGSGSYDLDGSIASYNWYVNDSLVNSKDSILSYFFKLGTNTIKLVVVDNDSGKDTSSSILNLTALQKQFQSGILGGISAINQNYILTADTSYNSITGSSVSLLDRLGNTIIPIVVQSKIFTTPSVSSDSSIFITNGSSLNGYSKVGVSLWPTIPLGGISYVTPTIDSNLSRIYVGVSNKNFFAYDYKTGKNVWSIICDAPINTSAVISGDRKLIFTSQSGTLYGFDISKSDVQTTPKWKLSFGDIVTKSPAVDASSNIYVGTDAGRLIKFMLNTDGTVSVKWNVTLSSSIQTSPVIDADSNIYVGTEKGDFYKIDRSNGTTIWSYNVGAAIHSTPNISEYGTIYVPNMNGLVTAITTDKRVLWKYQDIAAISANMLYINNMLYVASEKGTFTGIYDNPNSVNVNTTFASTDKSSITSFGSASSTNSMSFASILDNINSNPKSNITSNGLPTTLARTPVWGTFQGDYRRTGTLSIVCPSNLTISKDSTGSLISNTSNYIQWYKDGTAITNAVSSIFKPSTAGSYSVKNNQVGCNTIASNSYYYIVTDVINLSAGEFIKISPNPFINQLNFDFAVKGYQRLNLEVFDIATGSKKASIQNLTPGMQINLSQLAGGTYIIKVSSNDGKINYQFKMIKL